MPGLKWIWCFSIYNEFQNATFFMPGWSRSGESVYINVRHLHLITNWSPTELGIAVCTSWWGVWSGCVYWGSISVRRHEDTVYICRASPQCACARGHAGCPRAWTRVHRKCMWAAHALAGEVLSGTRSERTQDTGDITSPRGIMMVICQVVVKSVRKTSQKSYEKYRWHLVPTR